MKTIWHWNNIIKTVLIVFIIAILYGLIAEYLNLPEPIAFIGSATIGAGGTLVCLKIWDLWHFE